VDSFTLNKLEFDAVRRILAGFCSCSLGKGMALRITPSKNPPVVRKWLAQTDQMVRAIRDHGIPPLAGATDISEALGRARPGGGAGGEDFAAIAAALEAVGSVRKHLHALPEDMDALREIAAELPDFEGELHAIRSIVDPDGRVSDSASQRLAGIRKELAQVSQHIHDVIYGYLHQPDVAKLLQNAAVTLHGDRFVLPVKAEYRARLSGVVHRESQTGATLFVEPEACVELNNRLVDLHEEERAEIERLLNQLGLRVQGRAVEMAGAMRVLANVDVLSAKAQYAFQFAMTAPVVSENGPLEFRQARHPLLVERAWRQEKSGLAPEKRRPVVPIDVRLGSDFDLLVITGSNTGGKTVSLKTVGLLAIMAQSGMFLPAGAGSFMPVFRDIYIDVGDEQSLQQSLSTFGAHIRRIRYILSKADKNSLVLLDELGSGTDPDEGGAIGQAVLDELREIGCVGMASTHLSSLKAYAYLTPRVDNASVDFDTDTLSPTYHLRIGTPGESHAITVAAKLGLPKRLTAAARRHQGEQSKLFRKAIAATTTIRQEAEEARQQATTAQLAAQSQQEIYQARLADLHRVKEDFETWLAMLPDLKPGDEIVVPARDLKGRLVRLEIHKQIALIDTGSMEVEVPLRELIPDLGQSAVREEIASLRQQILDQANQTRVAMDDANHVRQEYAHSLQQQKERARQFDMWLVAIARVKTGDEVSIAIRPGKGKLVELDLPGLKAKVQTEQGEISVSLQDLFPQTGPFSAVRAEADARAAAARAEAAARAAQGPPPRREERGTGRPQQQGRPGDRRPPAPARREPAQAAGGPERYNPPRVPFASTGVGQRAPAAPRSTTPEPPVEPGANRPLRHRSSDSKAALDSREALLATEPGKPVYIIPFDKRATLIRIDAQKDMAVVQSGIFEMEIPLSDLEPVRPPPPPPPPPAKPHKAPREPAPASAPAEPAAAKPEEAPAPPPAQPQEESNAPAPGAAAEIATPPIAATEASKQTPSASEQAPPAIQ
jgi:DNA mismatch repair protein MutS2